MQRSLSESSRQRAAEALKERTKQLNRAFREQVLATPYLTHLIGEQEGRAMLTALNLIESEAFKLRALSRGHDIAALDEAVSGLLLRLEQLDGALHYTHCATLGELLEAMALTVEMRRRDTLDLLILTLLDLRSTWAHALSVVAPTPT